MQTDSCNPSPTADPAPVYDSAERRLPLLGEMRELVRYRDLLWQMIARNLKTRYKRSVLGIFWTLLNPLIMMLILTLVFATVFQGRMRNYPVHVLSGLVLWTFFSQTTAGAMSELVWGGGLMHRIYLPRMIFAATALGTGLVNLLFSLIPLFLIMLATDVPIRLSWLFLPVPILLTAMFTFGMALCLSTLVAYFADVLDMYQLLLVAWMYLTPIIYPKEIIPAHLQWVMNFNPMYHLLETFRAPLYAGSIAGPKTLSVATVIAVGTFFFGWWIFARKADEIAYRI